MNEGQWHWDEEDFVALGEDPGESISQVLRMSLTQSSLSKKLVIGDQREALSPSIKPSVDRSVIVIGLNKDGRKRSRSSFASALTMTSPTP